MTTDLIELKEQSERELAEVRDLISGVNHLNKLKAIETYIRAEKKGREFLVLAAEQLVRTERKLGELIIEGQLAGEIATKGNKSTLKQNAGGEEEDIKTLADLGITHKQSSLFQKIASIPTEKFEGFINEKKEVLTTASVVRFANKLTEKPKPEPVIVEEDGLPAEVIAILDRIKALPAIYRLKIKNAIK
jgi:hypothetical protein